MGQFTCSHPNCGHIADLITKAHCRNHHKMEREDIIKKYGEFKETRDKTQLFSQKRMSEIRCTKTRNRLTRFIEHMSIKKNLDDAALKACDNNLHATKLFKNTIEVYYVANDEFRSMYDLVKK